MKFYAIVLFTILFITACATTFDGYNDSNIIINKTNYGRMVIGNGRNSFGNTYAFTANSFGGIKEIATLKKEGILDIYASLKFTSGRLKIVLVKGSEIITISDGMMNGNINLSDIDDGIYKLKMVGDNAKDINISITCSQFYFSNYNDLRQQQYINIGK
jgi:hypothetical protein